MLLSIAICIGFIPIPNQTPPRQAGFEKLLVHQVQRIEIPKLRDRF
jgi:hypothetical protein